MVKIDLELRCESVGEYGEDDLVLARFVYWSFMHERIEVKLVVASWIEP